MNTPFFKAICVRRAEFPLRLAFSHHLATRCAVETLLVEIVAAGENSGYGQALPRAYLTGESLESVLGDIRDRWWPILSNMRFSPSASLADARDALEPMFVQANAERKNASYAAVEMAALDAFARAAKLPLTLGRAGAVGQVPLVGVITAGKPGKAAWLARIMKWLGYRRFKVKVGADADADAERLAAVRKVIGPDAWLSVDANQAWGWDEAVSRLRAMRAQRIVLAEEPLRPEDAAGADFAELEKAGGMPLMADESVCTTADAEKLLGRGSPSWWNLRFGKNGGFLGLRRLSALARANGIHIYAGVLVGETSALAAAGRACMFALPAECAEYGFPRLFVKGDPFRGGPGGWTGMMDPPPPGTQGLGITLLEKKLAANGRTAWSAGGIGDE